MNKRRSRLQLGYCFGGSRRSAQATVGKELAQGPYVAARARVEPTTFRLKVIDSTNVNPRPTSNVSRLMVYRPHSKFTRTLILKMIVFTQLIALFYCVFPHQQHIFRTITIGVFTKS